MELINKTQIPQTFQNPQRFSTQHLTTTATNSKQKLQTETPVAEYRETIKKKAIADKKLSLNALQTTLQFTETV